jgi:2-polyprenyl-3-methyl-5-hydroxy-6-metoxy-1,4-benzoquinol methylase
VKQTPATDEFNQNIFDLLRDDALKILEIGTGSGAMANAYKMKNSSVKYIGVEIFPEYKTLSERYCDKVYLEDFESPSKALIDETYDADFIIFADVLEHMINPWKVLQLLASRIPDHCRVIASIPNIQHWSIQMRLMSGDFRYADSGLLDRTHLRFFTRKTILTLFLENGFSINQIIPRIFDFPNQDTYLNLVRNNARTLELDEQEAVLDAASFQFVIDAQKQL